MNQQDLIALARQTATASGLDDALVCAVCEQESAWNPFALRYERAFYVRYIEGNSSLGNLSSTEMESRAFSWGLMQLMGQTAREAGYAGQYLSALCDPQIGLAFGCKVLKKKLDSAGGDTANALLAWNGGSNPDYPGQVLARMAKYQVQDAASPDGGTQ